jgi:putative transposase
VEDVAKNLKGSSSHYINKGADLGEVLYWQSGYGVITIRESDIPKVVDYIKRQKEHHLQGALSKIIENIV